jgi:putative ABC transport system permease protein
MFDLEKAIRQWRKELRKNEALEDGYIAELEAHLREEIENQTSQGISEEEAFEKAIAAVGDVEGIGAEFYKTNTRHLSGYPPWKTPRLMPALFWNYIKIAFRKIKRHKGYSFINIAGLAVGIACCIFIILFVWLELSFDTYHPDVKHIFRVGLIIETEQGKRAQVSNLIPMGPALKENYPQVKYAGRVCIAFSQPTVKYQDKMFKEEDIFKADSEIFSIFHIPFVQGDPTTALDGPNTAVLTEFIAEKYFSEENPLGKTLKINEKVFMITGVVKNPPQNTHLQFGILLSYEIIDEPPWMRGWHALAFPALTYIKLMPGVSPEEFEKQISRVPHEYIGEQLKEMGAVYTNFLQPIRDIHLYSYTEEGKKPSRNLIYIYIFSVVGVLILLIACMNFMNLSTARSANRSGEVGIRKVVGAKRGQLVRQFIGESLIISFISLIVALTIVHLALSLYNNLAGTQFTSSVLFQPTIILGSITLALFVGVAAGIYPAIFLSAFQPVSVLKGSLRAGSRGSIMRKVLVVGQFGISIALIIATIIVYRQLNYMRNQPLGFDKEQKLVLVLSGWDVIEDNYDIVKEEFLRHSSVTSATASSGVPGRGINRLWIYPSSDEPENGQTPMILRCDQDFISVYGIKMLAGRPFQKEMGTDKLSGNFIINEAAVKSFGWDSLEEAVDRQIMVGSRRDKYKVIGVVKDFHWYGLQNAIEPFVARFVSMYRYITLNVNTENLPQTLSFIEDKYGELFPDQVFEYFFVDTDFDRQYSFEERLGRIFRIFTFLGIFIACLGLFGMAAFIAEQRTKEIGIRKVLGAPVSGIVFLLSKEFIRWILVANIIAWPMAYFAVHRWLQNFAYRTNIGLEIFILSAVLALLIALFTVSFQAVKAATSNPVDSLRYE